MEISTAVWIICGLGLGVVGMIWHLARRAKKYEKSITLESNKSSIYGTGNLVIQNSRVRQDKVESKSSKSYTGSSIYKNKVKDYNPNTSNPGIGSTSTFDTSGTVIWPTEDSPRVIHSPSNDDHVSFGGGSFGGGGAGDSYDSTPSHSHSDSGSSWGGDSGSSYSSDTSSYDSGSSWSSSD